MTGPIMALAAGLALGSGALEPPGPAVVLERVTEAEVRALAEELGWTYGGREDLDPGAFSLQFTLPSGMPAYFDGLLCGAAGAAGCSEYRLITSYGVGDPARAADLAARIDFQWLSDAADGETLTVWRMEFAYGGQTRAHLGMTLATFEDLVDRVSAEVFPCGLPVDGQPPPCPETDGR